MLGWEAMKSVHGSGPYRLVGYSYGACLAFEMALSLETAGETDIKLVLIDSSHLYMSTYRSLPLHLIALLPLTGLCCDWQEAVPERVQDLGRGGVARGERGV